jgi:dTDP-glucose 4,6-dehydratase
MRLLVTGGAGFIGSAFVRMYHREHQIVVLDALTYAGYRANIPDDVRFYHGDICDEAMLERAIGKGVDAIVNFAAETHVDRSIRDASRFIKTSMVGTHVLLEAVRRHKIERFVQVSTDEVYGDVARGFSKETDALQPRNPYSAAKAAGDMLCLSYHNTYGTPVVITRGSNTYGPYQHPEKLIPCFTSRLIQGLPPQIHGDGEQVRDWLYVEDHAAAVMHVLERGQLGEAYNVAAGVELSVNAIASLLGSLIAPVFVEHVSDRPGGDRRYAMNTTKVRELGWEPSRSFLTAVRWTVDWYRENAWWWKLALERSA